MSGYYPPLPPWGPWGYPARPPPGGYYPPPRRGNTLSPVLLLIGIIIVIVVIIMVCVANYSSLRSMVDRDYRDGYNEGVWGANHIPAAPGPLGNAYICSQAQIMVQLSNDPSKNDNWDDWISGCSDAVKHVRGR